jgi:hypothetical protein
MRFTEHDHGQGRGSAHARWLDRIRKTAAHSVPASIEAKVSPRGHSTSERNALLVILGSSPTVEAIPVFFAAGKYGIGLIIAQLAISTIAAYVLLCLFSTVGLQRVQLGAFERYGEVLSGAFIALIGVAFWVWPMMRTN